MNGLKTVASAARPHVLENLREIRAFLTPDLREHFQNIADPVLADLFPLLRHLRPGDVETAKVAHRALLQRAGVDLRERGWVDAVWVDLQRLVFNFLEAEGLRFHDGRWVPHRRGHF